MIRESRDKHVELQGGTSRGMARRAVRIVGFLVAVAVGGLVLAAAPPALALQTGIEFGTGTGLSTQDIRLAVANIIRISLGILGIIALLIVLAGGALWMFSGGNEQQITKAKRLLANGAIGLTIILLAFSITQFVISRLVEATTGGGRVVTTVDNNRGRLPGPGGCVDPGGTTPFICTVSPSRGGVGSFVTIRGYRFGAFAVATSTVRIGARAATIVACNGSPNWSDNLVVVEVPTLTVGRDYPVEVLRADGVANGNAVTFGVTSDPLGPQIACVTPAQGPEGTAVSVQGRLFGATSGTVRFSGGVDGRVTSWADDRIAVQVPTGAQTGDLAARSAAGGSSNGYPFQVTCTANAQCSTTNCCASGMCVAAGFCTAGGGGGLGQSCDANTATPACEVGPCQAGLRCNSGTCRCDEGPVILDVSPQTFVDTATGTAYRRREDAPPGTSLVVAPNGAPGGYLTIRGRGFGSTTGRVTFVGGAGTADDVRARTPVDCPSAWSDTLVVIEIPALAPVGPIRLETSDIPPFADQTDDARGTAIEHFRRNGTQRPALCGITPNRGLPNATVDLRGTQFGGAPTPTDAVFFGDIASLPIVAADWNDRTIRARVPNVAEGAAEVRVQRRGERSNAVVFTRLPEVLVPNIREITPASGGPGQYVTIRGERFGLEIGKIFVRRSATEEYEVLPRFPAACGQHWWRDTEITLRIPAATNEWGPPTPQAGFTPTGDVSVRIQARSGGQLVDSNAVNFTVTGATASPGICAIVPNRGPGQTAIRILGERFGGAEGVLRFFDRTDLGAGDRSTDPAAPYRWTDGEVSGTLVPRAARTGPVQLWRSGVDPNRDDDANRPGLQGNEGSNPVTFEVRDCRAGGGANACAGGTLCCPDGACRQQCAATPNVGAYQWTFSTGVVPRVPLVVESCGAPSPAPWDQQGEGSNACVNARIRIEFTASMAAPDGRLLRTAPGAAAAAVQIQRCLAGGNIAAGGNFEPPADLTGWRIPGSTAVSPLQTQFLTVTRNAVGGADVTRGGSVLRLQKSVRSVGQEPRTVDLPRDATNDRRYFAVEAPGTLIPDTNGTRYTARVYVRGNAVPGNRNVRAGLVVGRAGGADPTAPGWWQQGASEVALDGSWQELRTTIGFDGGANARQANGTATPGFLRVYVTGPPAGEPTAADDLYGVQVDGLSVVREGDPCAQRANVQASLVTIGDAPGRFGLRSNVIEMLPPSSDPLNANAPRRWDPGTTYEVVVDGDQLRGADPPRLRLDGDEDGNEGGRYRFRFKTRSSTIACAARGIVATPAAATLTQPWTGSAVDVAAFPQHDGLVHVGIGALPDPAACYFVDLSGIAGSWQVTQPPGAPPDYAVADTDQGGPWCAAETDCGVVPCATNADCGGAVQCVNRQCTTTFCAGGANAPGTGTRPATISRCENLPDRVTVRASRETPVGAGGTPQPVTVRATLLTAPPQSASATVEVRFARPRVIAVAPVAGCQEACPNARIAAAMSVPLQSATVRGSVEGNPTVEVRRCANESCSRAQLGPVVPMTARACPAAGAPGDDPWCAQRRIQSDPQLIGEPAGGAALETDTSYRVILRGGSTGILSQWGVPLDDLAYDGDGDGTPDAYSWTFRTRSQACGVHRVEVSPDPVPLRLIGERALVTAIPRSAPDRCNPAGQVVAPGADPWGWAIPNPNGAVANFTRVGATGGFEPPGPAALTRSTSGSGPGCTNQCRAAGSRRLIGVCGNGVLEAPAEECERVDGTGTPSPTGTFLGWCDPATCLRLGASPRAQGGTCGDGQVQAGEECDGTPGCSERCLHQGSAVAGSTCGNGDPARPTDRTRNTGIGDGEDCDDRNTVSGDGCSATCLSEGSPPQFDAVRFPAGVRARCGNGQIEQGESCDLPGNQGRAAWTAAGCDFDRCIPTGAASIPGGTCGNGRIDVGEECDDGAVGGSPVGGDGCSATCLHEGASLDWRNQTTGAPQPSVCGDGIRTTYGPPAQQNQGGETCDVGNAIGPPDATQIVVAVGRGTVDAQGVQRTPVTASRLGVVGTGQVELQCGFRTDDECPASQVNGVTRQGCCAPRPTITAQVPLAGATNVCRNARISIRFDQELDRTTVDRAVALERCRPGTACGAGVDADWEPAAASAAVVETVAASGATVHEVHLQPTAPLAPSLRYRVVIRGSEDDAPTTERSLRAADGVRFRRANAGTGTVLPWTFTTAADVCAVSEIVVTPGSYLLQRREDQARLRATAIARSGSLRVPVEPVTGYRWEYEWSSAAADLVTVAIDGRPSGQACTDVGQCASRRCDPAGATRQCTGPAVAAVAQAATAATRNGGTFAIATARFTENLFGAVCGQTAPCANGLTCANGRCVGQRVSGRAPIRLFLCENPWPPVVNPATWSPYPRPPLDLNGDGIPEFGGDPSGLTDERLSLAYCRDQGTRKVCKVAPDAAETGREQECTQDGDCTRLGVGFRCIPARVDDLPDLQLPPVERRTQPAPAVDGRDDLREEYLLLPRGASYCSGSGQRCEAAVPGACPGGEFCRPGQDAVGLRLYENERHARVDRWYRDRGFTESTSPVTVDGYRGVRAGRTTYLNIANLGSIFTNALVLSVNDGAVGETQEVLRQLLDGIRFNTDLEAQNLRTCTVQGQPVSRCAESGRACRQDADCPVRRCGGAGRTCAADADCAAEPTGQQTCGFERCDVQRPFPCTADAECTVGTLAGSCRSPKDKLQRDVQRVEDLQEIRSALAQFGSGRRRCSVTPTACATDGDCPIGERCAGESPPLSAGTYVPGLTVSRWPSWQQELGSALGAPLPVDPLNRFGGACVADPTRVGRYDAQTCWNQQDRQYTCPAGSFVYQYRRSTGGTVRIGAVFEFAEDPTATRDVRWLPPLPPEFEVAYTTQPTAICSATASYGTTGRCGDNSRQGDEECDPPGTPDTAACVVRRCATTGPICADDADCAAQPVGQRTCTLTGAAGQKTRTCGRDCRWSVPNAEFVNPNVGRCGAQCGNSRVDPGTAEQCDVGASGGRVRPTAGVIPGVTVGTQYACSTVCQWTGGRCGDAEVQLPFGEQCDGAANVALQPRDSSATTAYACTALTDPAPCQRTGGYCGDGVVQSLAPGAIPIRVCRNAQQVEGATCQTDTDCSPGSRCVLRRAPAPADLVVREQCDGDEARRCVVGRSCSQDPTRTCTVDSECGAGNRCDNLLTSILAREGNGAFNIPFSVQAQSGALGTLTLTLETSNFQGTRAPNDGLDTVTSDIIEASLPAGTTIADFNPDGARGTQGVYHRLRILTIQGGTATPQGTVWALASASGAPRQVNQIALGNMPSGNHTLRVDWDNDWSGLLRGASIESNLRISRASVEAIQTRTCGATGTPNACQPLDAAGSSGAGPDVGWGGCQAVGAACGNGRVDTGEECDDGGRGRCTNDPLRACQRNEDCRPQDATQSAGACDRDIDQCTGSCRFAVCGDARELAPTCMRGDASRIGNACRTSAECGRGGECRSERCDLGVSNWRQQCQPGPLRCLRDDGTVGAVCDVTAARGAACPSGPGRCGDPRCVDDAVCPYGRTCNYCVQGSCAVATKQGGFCGDRTRNGPEACEVLAPATSTDPVRYDLAGRNCTNFSLPDAPIAYDYGTLACAAACSFDTRGCRSCLRESGRAGLAPAAALTVQVRDAVFLRNLSGASVTLLYGGETRPDWAGRTDANGRVTFSGIDANAACRRYEMRVMRGARSRDAAGLFTEPDPLNPPLVGRQRYDDQGYVTLTLGVGTLTAGANTRTVFLPPRLRQGEVLTTLLWDAQCQGNPATQCMEDADCGTGAQARCTLNRNFLDMHLAMPATRPATVPPDVFYNSPGREPITADPRARLFCFDPRNPANESCQSFDVPPQTLIFRRGDPGYDGLYRLYIDNFRRVPGNFFQQRRARLILVTDQGAYQPSGTCVNASGTAVPNQPTNGCRADAECPVGSRCELPDPTIVAPAGSQRYWHVFDMDSRTGRLTIPGTSGNGVFQSTPP